MGTHVPTSDFMFHVLVFCLLCAGHCVEWIIQQRPMGSTRMGLSEEWRLEPWEGVSLLILFVKGKQSSRKTRQKEESERRGKEESKSKEVSCQLTRSSFLCVFLLYKLTFSDQSRSIRLCHIPALISALVKHLDVIWSLFSRKRPLGWGKV